ncbi:hypothetical protein HDU98_007610 [Podochytrium sp. JEL0797]|nr:hypothetical protein HDU98_007610 [Podochytrium sp. JEL0797]
MPNTTTALSNQPTRTTIIDIETPNPLPNPEYVAQDQLPISEADQALSSPQILMVDPTPPRFVTPNTEESLHQSMEREPASFSLAMEAERATSTLLVTLPIQYHNPEHKFFEETRPDELEALISSQAFYARMHELNEKLERFRTLKDFSPLFRTFMLATIPVITLFSFLYNVAWLGALVFVTVILLASYFNDGAVFRLLKTHVEQFNETDAPVNLKWSITPRFPQNQKPLFCWSQEKAGVAVDWKLHVRQVSKHPNMQTEFLPAYSPFIVMLSEMVGSDLGVGEIEAWEDVRVSELHRGSRRPPSYCTLA